MSKTILHTEKKQQFSQHNGAIVAMTLPRFIHSFSYSCCIIWDNYKCRYTAYHFLLAVLVMLFL